MPSYAGPEGATRMNTTHTHTIQSQYLNHPHLLPRDYNLPFNLPGLAREYRPDIDFLTPIFKMATASGIIIIQWRHHSKCMSCLCVTEVFGDPSMATTRWGISVIYTSHQGSKTSGRQVAVEATFFGAHLEP